MTMNDRSLRHVVSRDWRVACLRCWNAVPRHWRLAFFAALAVNVVVFFFDLAQFPLGDHDVGYADGIPLLSGGRAGRWFTPALHALSGHVQIPVWTQLLAFSSQIAAAMGAVLLWRPRATAWPLFAGAIVVSCMPSVTGFYYYHYMALAFTASQLFMVLALHLSLAGEGHARIRRLAATVLCVFAMAAYQSSIMTWIVCFWGLLLVRLAHWDGCRATLAALFASLAPPFLCFAAACLLYATSLRLYPLVGLSLGLYQFDTIAISALPARIMELARESWAHLVTPSGFLTPWLTALLCCAAAAGAWTLLSGAANDLRGRSLRLSLLVAGLALFPLAAKSQFLVSASGSWLSFRFHALGMSYLYAFLLLALLVDRRPAARNAGFALFALLLPCMAVNDLDQQIRHVRAVEHDQAVLNRVLARIESLPDYDPGKVWNLVQLGRTRPYLEDPGTVPLRGSTISQAWHPGYELRMLSRYLKLGDRLNEEIRLRPDLMEKALAWARGRRAFPAPEGVGIVGDTIVLLFDENACETAAARLKTLRTQRAE